MKQIPEFPRFYIVDHPLISDRLSRIRDKNCPVGEFRARLREIGMLMTYEATAHLPMTTRTIDTPLMQMEAPVLACPDMVIVPILRAGLGLVDGPLSVMPEAIVAHIGVYRDEETHLPHEYLVRLPAEIPQDRHFLIVDPMLATGHSALHTIDILVGRGVAPEKITLMVVVACPEGVRAIQAKYPDMPVFAAALDTRLNEKAYIEPGLGDAGDRLFGTL